MYFCSSSIYGTQTGSMFNLFMVSTTFIYGLSMVILSGFFLDFLIYIIAAVLKGIYGLFNGKIICSLAWMIESVWNRASVECVFFNIAYVFECNRLHSIIRPAEESSGFATQMLDWCITLKDNRNGERRFLIMPAGTAFARLQFIINFSRLHI